MKANPDRLIRSPPNLATLGIARGIGYFFPALKDFFTLACIRADPTGPPRWSKTIT